MHISSQDSRLDVHLQLRSPRPLTTGQIEKWRTALSSNFSKPVSLTVEVELGQSLRLP